MVDSAHRNDRLEKRMRLDVWLWRTRLFKTRSAASDAVETSGVRLERSGQVRRIDKPSVTVSVGDRLSYVSPDGVTVVRVLALPPRTLSGSQRLL
jgi:ribosome-associated heat shock protein Hsp15